MSQPTVLMIGSDPSEQGGIGTVLSTYERQGFLADKRFIVSHREGPALERIRLFLSALFQLFWLMLTQRSIRLLHMHMSERASVLRKGLFAQVAKLFGKKVAYHLHGAEFLVEYQGYPSWLQRLIRAQLDQADAIFVLSDSWRRDLAALTQNPNIQVVYNPVPLPPAVSPQRPGQPLRCLFLGRYGQRKGVYDLLAAVAQLPEGLIQLDLYGDGEVDAVKAQANSSVRVNGWIRGDAKLRALAEADVLLLPSYNEGLPVAILARIFHRNVRVGSI
jgi:glycosyltransferase involved in cell wall biosynthesis